MRRTHRQQRRLRIVGVVVIVIFGLLVVGGYILTPP
jgi:hypothetical protein